MTNFILSSPYLLTVFKTPTKYKIFNVYTDEGLDALREELDRNEMWYTISCSKKEKITPHHIPARISGPTKKSNGTRNTAIRRITKSANNLSSAYTKAMESLLKAWK